MTDPRPRPWLFAGVLWLTSCQDPPRPDASTTSRADAPEAGARDGGAGHTLRDARSGPVDAPATLRDARSGPVDAPATRPPFDAGSSPSSCPAWTVAADEIQAWAFARVVSSDGRLLTHQDSHLDVFTRSLNPPGAVEVKADPNDPCAVANYLRTTLKLEIRAAAPGFSSRKRIVTPGVCTVDRPCTIQLPRRLAPAYYVGTHTKTDRLLAADELPPSASKTAFAADVTQDAIERARASKRSLETELKINSDATRIPMNDLVTTHVEKKLGRACDAACIDDPRLDAKLRELLRDMKDDGVDPFRHRTRPDLWRGPIHRDLHREVPH